MDYEKAYKEALERARGHHGVAINYGKTEEIQELEHIFPELSESEDERIRKKLIQLVNKESGWQQEFPSQCQCLAWLEKQKEQKPAEWSEEDVGMLNSIIATCQLAAQDRGSGPAKHLFEMQERFLKSLRPQPHKEIYQAAKHDLAIRFMNYLDENRPEGKMSLSNGECEDIDNAFKENDWSKIMRYAEKYSPSWKPSEEQMKELHHALTPGSAFDCDILNEFYEQLNRFRQEG
jgi:hypothetical protein